ncbi:DUF1501 domain-containing protein [Parasulfitobacter algicola]|uniref:DUF1501 domain-containing protein n=1 Tax=Parasulfitobacter algicola TaxID=2614809 RepID=A0ABX2IZE7_9RHOB|nr:DUF1501 domain-containing protein [Sulfitobacter algicola]NSX56109.1 DUF1501 domain-containing protein [Sulfitobacter algicola]
MTQINRRKFITALGCSAAASPFLTPIALAAGPWDARLVVIILRGGMDGLDVARPYGDPAFSMLRRGLAKDRDASHDLDGFFSAHPALDPIIPLWTKGELGFVQAVSTPYRDKRSHFDGQDLLEAGTTDLGQGARDGWLNRMLQTVPGITAQTGFAIGREEMRVMSGSAPFGSWSPDADLNLSPQAIRLLELVYHDHPNFRDAAAEAMDIAKSLDLGDVQMEPDQMMMQMQQRQRQTSEGGEHTHVARFAADRLKGDTRIATFSINGWDTHANQARGMKNALARLSDTIVTLRDELGPIWGKTAVLAMTEFGRTARENGTKGTDHGTGGAMITAGGALRGGQVLGQWPGLTEAALYDRRDLMPTADVRGYSAWVMKGLFGLDQSTLESAIFPGLDMGANPGLLA